MEVYNILRVYNCYIKLFK